MADLSPENKNAPDQTDGSRPLASQLREMKLARHGVPDESPAEAVSDEGSVSAAPQVEWGQSSFFPPISFGHISLSRPEGVGFGDCFKAELFEALRFRADDSTGVVSVNETSLVEVEQASTLDEGWMAALNNISGFGTTGEGVELWCRLGAGLRLAAAVERECGTKEFGAIEELGKTPDTLREIGDDALSLRYHELSLELAREAREHTSGKEVADLKVYEAIQQLRLAVFKKKGDALRIETVNHYLKAGLLLEEVLERHGDSYTPESRYAILRYGFKAFALAVEMANEESALEAGTFWLGRTAAEGAERLFDKTAPELAEVGEPSHLIADWLTFVKAGNREQQSGRGVQWSQRLLLLPEPAEEDGNSAGLSQACCSIAYKFSRALLDDENGRAEQAASAFEKAFSHALEFDRLSADNEASAFCAHLVGDFVLGMPVVAISEEPLIKFYHAFGRIELLAGEPGPAEEYFLKTLTLYAGVLSSSGTLRNSEYLAYGVESLLKFEGGITSEGSSTNAGVSLKSGWWKMVDVLEEIATHHLGQDEKRIALEFSNLAAETIQLIGNRARTDQKDTIAKVSERFVQISALQRNCALDKVIFPPEDDGPSEENG